jgi:hypothetical protein
VVVVTRQPYVPAAWMAKLPQPEPISTTWSSGPSSSFRHRRSSLATCADSRSWSTRSKTAEEYVMVESRKEAKNSLLRS